MVMSKAPLIYLSILLILFASCKRNDFENLPGALQKAKCDYVQASSPYLSMDHTQTVPLFTKIYNAQNRLDKILVRFRNVATPFLYPSTLDVSYQPSRVVFVREEDGDTAAVLELHPSGKIISARAATPFYLGWEFQRDYAFTYSGNRLQEIQIEEEDAHTHSRHWNPFVQVTYDKGNKNVSKIIFGGIGQNASYDSIQYQYDYSRKANAQVYPDDMLGDYHQFFFFLKYLNIFPELQPENILTGSSYGSTLPFSYPSYYDRKYSDHTFDAQGKLISYKQNSSRPTDQVFDEEWQVDWKCFK
jgi:hypothetical protein